MKNSLLFSLLLVRVIATAQLMSIQSEKLVTYEDQSHRFEYFTSPNQTLFRICTNSSNSKDFNWRIEVINNGFGLIKTIPFGTKFLEGKKYKVGTVEEKSYIYLFINESDESVRIAQFNKKTYELIFSNDVIKLQNTGLEYFADSEVAFLIQKIGGRGSRAGLFTRVDCYNFSNHSISEVYVRNGKEMFDDCQILRTHGYGTEFILAERFNKYFQGKIFSSKGIFIKDFKIDYKVGNNVLQNNPSIYKNAKGEYKIYGGYYDKSNNFLGYFSANLADLGSLKLIAINEFKNFEKGLKQGDRLRHRAGKRFSANVTSKLLLWDRDLVLMLTTYLPESSQGFIYYSKLGNTMIFKISEDGELKFDYSYNNQSEYEDSTQAILVDPIFKGRESVPHIHGDTLSIITYMGKSFFRVLDIDKTGKVLHEEVKLLKFQFDNPLIAKSPQTKSIFSWWFDRSFLIIGESYGQSDKHSLYLYRYGY